MDATIWVAVIAGAYGTLGAVLKIVEKYFPGKTPAKELPPAPLPDHMDERIRWYVDRLDRERAEERAEHVEQMAECRRKCDEKLDKMRTDYEQLQTLYQEALDRIESLGVDEGRGPQ